MVVNLLPDSTSELQENEVLEFREKDEVRSVSKSFSKTKH
jgi:hypothetical protein